MNPKQAGRDIGFMLLVASLLLAGCHAPLTQPPALQTVSSLVQPLAGPPKFLPTRTPFQPLPNTPTPAPPTSTPTRAVALAWLPAYLPANLLQSLALPAYQLAADPAQAALRVGVDPANPATHWVYVLAAPFATIDSGVSAEDLRRAWVGEGQRSLAGQPLLLDESTLGMFSALWGAPAIGAVQVLPTNELLGYAWDHRPAWALLPFEQVEPRWTVLEINGQTPLHKDFDPPAYPLSIPIAIKDPDGVLSGVVPVNYAPEKLTSLTMTGVTALVRATAFTMEQRGVTYPGKDVRDWLRAADLTHISNEVPFARDCPFPNPTQQGVRFCSDSRYIALLEDVGADIIELTGDHFHDYGNEAMLYTLELYRQRDWLVYGGGANLEEGRRAVTLEHNGNRLAFIGCNAKGGSFAQAGPRQPGSAACAMSWMADEISRLSTEGYLPIATFQHFEYYTYQAQPDQKRDFRRLAEAGAVIVSGSQAHQPQGLEFVGQSFLHYGLGNLFFDQYEVSEATRQGFIDLHFFYDERYLGVQLLPILFIDYARPRPMTPRERNELLQTVFRASDW